MKLTLLALPRLVPVMVTLVPIGPLRGAKLLMVCAGASPGRASSRASSNQQAKDTGAGRPARASRRRVVGVSNTFRKGLEHEDNHLWSTLV